MPRAELRPTHTADELRAVARNHQLVLACLSLQLVGVFAFVAVTAAGGAEGGGGWLSLVVGLSLIVGVTSGVAVGLLAGSTRGAAAGVGLGLLAATPCLGLVVTLVVLVLANGVFRRHGVRVGPFGANARDLADLDPMSKADDAVGAYLPDDDDEW